MGVKVITPPAANLITVADLRMHLRLDSVDTTEDTLLQAMLLAAQDYAQHYMGRAVGSQTLELALDAFPSGSLDLPYAPVTSIVSVTYLNSAGAPIVLSNALYTLDDYGIQNWAVPAYNTSWPETYGAANAVKVRYVAGDLPAAVRSALLLMVGNLYENREATQQIQITELPLGAKALLDTKRIWSM